MGLTVFLIPVSAALFILSAALLIQGVRQCRRGKLFSAVGILAVLLAVYSILLEFITRPL